MAFIDKIKRDFVRHKKRAGVLGVLAAVMVVFIIKAVLEMSPANASASGVAIAVPGNGDTLAARTAPETPEQAEKAKEAWKTLHEVRGLKPDVAFTFDPAFYEPDPKRVRLPVAPSIEPVVITPKVPENNSQAIAAARQENVRRVAASLIVQSTVVGISKPMAIVNGHLLGVGDHIQGCEVMAIRSGEVDFEAPTASRSQRGTSEQATGNDKGNR